MTIRETPTLYSVNAHDREPLIAFIADALTASGCRLLHRPSADRAPFRFTFETPAGERMGLMVYAFRANTKLTHNRPDDEHRFQVKYGSKDGRLHHLWQDPYGLYVTLFVGINPDLGVFIGADPVLHSPTKFFISVEFKQAHVDEIVRMGWHAWERERRATGGDEGPVEVLVGGTASSFLRYVRFERDALREDQGHRQLLAESDVGVLPVAALPTAQSVVPSAARLHDLAREFEMREEDVLDLIAGARRLKMAVRGWVAEEHLVRKLRTVDGVTDCERLDEEGGPDVRLRFENSRPISVECKNVLRETTADGLIRVDFQRTRASKGDPCSRYYSAADFDVLAACTHAVELRWDFRFARTTWLDPHRKCAGKLSHLVRLDDRWTQSVRDVFRSVVNG